MEAPLAVRIPPGDNVAVALVDGQVRRPLDLLAQAVEPGRGDGEQLHDPGAHRADRGEPAGQLTHVGGAVPGLAGSGLNPGVEA